VAVGVQRVNPGETEKRWHTKGERRKAGLGTFKTQNQKVRSGEGKPNDFKCRRGAGCSSDIGNKNKENKNAIPIKAERKKASGERRLEDTHQNCDDGTVRHTGGKPCYE